MVLKYKCVVEVEMPFPDADDVVTRRAKAAVDELIDNAVYDAVFGELCDEKCELKVTRELLEYVADEPAAEDEKTDTTCCGQEENQPQDIVSEQA